MKINFWKISTIALFVVLAIFLLPTGRSDLSLANQFIQLITSSSQTQNPFEIQNSTGSTLLKIDLTPNITINDEVGNPSTIIGPRSGAESVSYIIFKEGNTIYAKNGTTGAIDFSGTSARIVIQSAINATNATGGTIAIRNGSYSLGSGLVISRGGYKIIGESRDGVDLEYLTNVGNAISDTATNTLTGFEIRSLSLIGKNDAGTPQSAINFTDFDRIIIDDVDIHFFFGTARSGIYLADSSNAIIEDSHFWNNVNSVNLTGASTNFRINDNYFFGSGTLLQIGGTSSVGRALGNLFESSSGTPTRVVISSNGNIFGSNSYEFYATGATDLSLTGTGNLIQGNAFTNNVTVTGAGNVLLSNKGNTAAFLNATTLNSTANVVVGSVRPTAASPTVGTIYFNNSAGWNVLQMFDGTNWRNLTVSAPV